MTDFSLLARMLALRRTSVLSPNERSAIASTGGKARAAKLGKRRMREIARNANLAKRLKRLRQNSDNR